MNDWTSRLAEHIRCPLCGGWEAKELWIAHDTRLGGDEVFRWVRCLVCGLVYLNPRPTVEELRRYYVPGMYGQSTLNATRDLVGKAGNPLRNMVLRNTKGYPGPTSGMASYLGRILAWRFDHIPPWVPGGRLLDIGTGAGRYVRNMGQLGWTAIGVDLDLSMISRARKTYKLEMALSEAAKLPFKEHSFDVVTMRHVIEHLADPVGALRGIRRILRVGGLLRIETPNVDSLQAKWFGSAWFHLDTPRHVILFGPNTLETALRREGYKVLCMRTMPSPVGLVGSLQIALQDAAWSTHGGRIRQDRLVRGLVLPIELLAVALQQGACLGVWARREAQI